MEYTQELNEMPKVVSEKERQGYYLLKLQADEEYKETIKNMKLEKYLKDLNKGKVQLVDWYCDELKDNAEYDLFFNLINVVRNNSQFKDIYNVIHVNIAIKQLGLPYVVMDKNTYDKAGKFLAKTYQVYTLKQFEKLANKAMNNPAKYFDFK